MAIATKVYNNRESPEDRQAQGLAKMLLVADRSQGFTGLRDCQLSQIASVCGEIPVPLYQKESMDILQGNGPLEEGMSPEKERTRGN